MITNIHRLKSFGIFKDYKSTGVNDFGKFNLIYGWNGCGKSTLSLIFEGIEQKRVPAADKFPSAEFEVTTKNGKITEKSIAQSNINIRTFNQNFVDTNIDWDRSVKSILLVAHENITEHRTLSSLKGHQEKDTQAYESQSQEIRRVEGEVSSFLTASAKRTKLALQVIDTSDSRYMNYNKAKLKSFIDENVEAILSIASVLKDHELAALTNAARPDQKAEIKLDVRKVDAEKLAQAKTRLEALLKERITGQRIERLTQHPDIQSWVHSGKKLHADYGSPTCEFCQNTISESRLKQIEAHFSDAYQAYKAKLQKADSWLDGQFISTDSLPLASDFFEELKAEFSTAKEQLRIAAEELNASIATWREAIRKKSENPFDVSIVVEPIDQKRIDTFNVAVASVAACVHRHNQKCKNFAEETAKAKQRLELHYAAAEAQHFGYFGKLKTIEDRREQNEKVKATIDGRKRDIETIEATLSDERLGAEEFNKALHKFLGRTDLTLRFNKALLGYEICRGGVERHDGNLSEGEKTAVAFILFMTKLEESGNRIKDTIVVIDDPVSSFDSNHIFCAYSFLRNRCKEVRQLIVLTHNFTFFKLVRDWFVKSNINRRNRKPPLPDNAFFYVVETSPTPDRQSVLVNAERSLIDYDSEYHYLFAKLYQYRDHKNLATDEAFLSANIARKLLESFFGFKHPKHRSDLDALLTVGLSSCKNTTQDIKERVYRFINKYSHGGVIEVNQDAAENLLGESGNVVRDILGWIEEVDEVHYQEMVAVTNL